MKELKKKPYMIGGDDI